MLLMFQGTVHTVVDHPSRHYTKMTAARDLCAPSASRYLQLVLPRSALGLRRLIDY